MVVLLGIRVMAASIGTLMIFSSDHLVCQPVAVSWPMNDPQPRRRRRVHMSVINEGAR
jgi:hypothetical protein